ncbi:MAG: serine/threonine protein kinase, partial [Planctomycetes bacterium]|nr:serine/threonine protein kinase [Planctomycetota bacterium]
MNSPSGESASPDDALKTVTFVDWSSTSSSGPTDGPEPRIEIGSYEQRYQIEKFVGAGGMGEVYRGRDRLLARDIALKYILPEHSADPTACARFWREALHSGGLGHPAIPPVHDVGLDSSGRPFYVMRLIRGTSLRGILDRTGEERWRVPRLLAVFVQVCGAVQFAHDAGTLHLDIKPENIMIGDHSDVYLVDWGLAESSDEVRHPAVLRGTPAYMSPEQVTGDAPVSSATDIFALGALLYEIVMGRRAFVGQDTDRVLDRVVAVEFERGAAWERAAPELRKAIELALDRRPDRRTGQAGDLAAAVQEFLDGRAAERRNRREARVLVETVRERDLTRDRLRRDIERERSALRSETPPSWATPAAKESHWERLERIEEWQ